jgi:tetratricopeptide (TPR) repeat protein
MAKKRKTRKELLKKPDEFMTTTGKVIQWGSQNIRQIGIGIGVVVIFLAVFTGLRFYLNYTENNASAMLQQHLEGYQAAERNDGPKAAYEKVSAVFQDFLEIYGNKKGGKLGRIHFANICYNAGKYDQAIDLFQQSLSDTQNDPSLKYIVLAGLAYSYEALNQYSDAIASFEKIRSAETTLLKDEALFHLGRLYAADGDMDKSLKAYEQLQKDFPNSVYVQVVEDILAI